MSKLSVLHISDSHIGDTILTYSVEEIAMRIAGDIGNHSKKIDCVVVTGDIFDGKHGYDIETAVSFFKKLRERLNKEIKLSNLKSEDFIFVPGNHDLIRTEKGADFNKYKEFLKKFHSENYYKKNYNDEYLYTVRTFKKEKIAIIGFNSCRVDLCDSKDISWINKVNWDKEKFSEEMIKAIKANIEDYYKSIWDDYGKIDLPQLTAAFDELHSKVPKNEEYTIVACFHHHFYPFPEIYTKFNDVSLMRNFNDVINELQRNKVKIILHGHKHLPIIRPITNQKYLSEPDSIMYVFSAGSVAKNGEEQSFQVIDIFNPNENRIADVKTFNYKKRELSNPQEYSIPPRKSYEKSEGIEILDVFSSEFSDEFTKYKSKLKEKDNVSSNSGINEIIQNIGKTITPFEKISKDFLDSPENFLTLLLSIHYRINALNLKRNNSSESEEILEEIKDYFKEINISRNHRLKIFKVLEASENSELEKCYLDLDKKSGQNEKTFNAYVIIAIFFTDLYLTLRQYGDFYYIHEGINANIRLKENLFHRNIPSSTIAMYSNTERRASFICFKCKDPTVHKVSVLIIKDFEKKLNKLEDSLGNLGLKIYYLIPKIEKDNYDLENFNFEAYIPTLLPLLTGKNLYKHKEVFVRELIQNCLDAILLREKLDSTSFDKTIRIEFGNEIGPDSKVPRRYLRITDEGVGMNTFKIERYFTSIGRSFYTSEEFTEMKKVKGVKYEPISSFGIGFLSVFMVCEEVKTVTRNYEIDSSALEIYIPNYDGCFFINKIKESTIPIGTSITLFEDTENLFEFDKIKEYINKTFLDFQLKIEIIDKENSCKEEIAPYKLKSGKEFALFIPMTEKGLERISWRIVKEGKHIENYSCGLLVDFDHESCRNFTKEKDFNLRKVISLNSGIRLYETKLQYETKLHEDNIDFGFIALNNIQYYNFPASYIQLDVAREKIKSFKDNNKYYNSKKALQLLAEQANELITYIKEERKELQQVTCNNIYLFFKVNELQKEILEQIKQKIFHLNIKVTEDLLQVSLQPNDVLPMDKSNSIDYEINQSLNIVNLLLLECLVLRDQCQLGTDSKRRKKEFYLDDKSLELLIKELLEMDYIPLSHCLNVFENNKELKDVVSKISRFEKNVIGIKESPSNISLEMDHYVRRIHTYGMSRLVDQLYSQIAKKELPCKIEEKRLRQIENDLILLSETSQDVQLDTERIIQTKMNEFFMSLLPRLYVENPIGLNPESDVSYKIFILHSYFKLSVFYNLTKFVQISQIDDFKIELKIKEK